jgi:hypothetical protein
MVKDWSSVAKISNFVHYHASSGVIIDSIMYDSLSHATTYSQANFKKVYKFRYSKQYLLCVYIPSSLYSHICNRPLF